jgi:hypothetical protein
LKVVLSRNGRLTKNGKFFEEVTGEKVGSSLPEPFRDGVHEYVNWGGKKKRLRSWDAVASKFTKYTATGRRYYESHRVEIIVHIPAKIEGARPNGQTYSRDGWFPITDLGLQPIFMRADLSPEQLANAVKIHVLQILPDFGDGVFYEVSSETWRYNPEVGWRISQMKTTPIEGNYATSVTLDRPLQGEPWLDCTHVPPTVIPEAFQDLGDCVPRQLGVILNEDFEELRFELGTIQDELYGGAIHISEGITPKTL